jgi:hypothetical protein
VTGFPPERLRVGRDAPSYLSPQAFTLAGMSPKTAALRPQVATLTLEEQVRRIAARGGWRVTKSDKGVYASESAQLSGARSLLRLPYATNPCDECSRHFVGEDRDAPGRLLADRRRYLTYRDFGEVASAEEAELVLAHLEEAGAVTRGLVLRDGLSSVGAQSGVTSQLTPTRRHRLRILRGIGGALFGALLFYGARAPDARDQVGQSLGQSRKTFPREHDLDGLFLAQPSQRSGTGVEPA